MLRQTSSHVAAIILRTLLFITLVVILAGCANTSGTTTAANGHYDDWWLCADNCGAEDADCIDACTDKFNEKHSDPNPPPFKLQRRTGHGHKPLGFAGQLCPAGTVASSFPMPVYDPIGPDGVSGTADDGLFVDHYETVWYCLPEDLEPEG